MTETQRTVWHKALEPAELPEGRVKTVACGLVQVCMTHHAGKVAALDNKCPHQGGPLGEGSIEGGYLRCPWHGWDFDPTTGKPPGGYDDGVTTYPVETREDAETRHALTAFVIALEILGELIVALQHVAVTVKNLETLYRHRILLPYLVAPADFISLRFLSPAVRA